MVLVGNVGYSGVEVIVNEVGGDGMVWIVMVNFNVCCLSFELDVCQCVRFGWCLEELCGEIVFVIVDGENYVSVVLKDCGLKNLYILELICVVLEVEDVDYWSSGVSFFWQCCIDQFDFGIECCLLCYLNLVSYVCDDFDQEVCDYFIQFFCKLNSDWCFEQCFYEQVIVDVYFYEDNFVYCLLYLLIEFFDDLFVGFVVDILLFSVLVQLLFDLLCQLVGYIVVGFGDSEGLVILLVQVLCFFVVYCILLLCICLMCLVDSGVFVFRNF